MGRAFVGFGREIVGSGREIVGSGREVIGFQPEIVGFQPEIVGFQSELVGLELEIAGIGRQGRPPDERVTESRAAEAFGPTGVGTAPTTPGSRVSTTIAPKPTEMSALLADRAVSSAGRAIRGRRRSVRSGEVNRLADKWIRWRARASPSELEPGVRVVRELIRRGG
jgi:hypothetical protein